MVLTSFANLVSNLYRQIAPGSPYGSDGSQATGSGGYECQGYARDSDLLRVVNDDISRRIEHAREYGIDLSTSESYQEMVTFREQIQNCLSDVGNVLTGSSGNDPSLGMYLGIAGGAAAGIAGLVFYMKSRNGKTRQSTSSRQ